MRMGAEDPIDLLEGATSLLTGTPGVQNPCSCSNLVIVNNRRHRKPGEDAKKFKLDEDTGKMIFDTSDSEAGADADAEAQRMTLGLLRCDLPGGHSEGANSNAAARVRAAAGTNTSTPVC